MADSLLLESLEQALAEVSVRSGIAVAVSGGPDSSALAICARQWARERGLELRLFHVHHGLHNLADQWTSKVQQLADLLECALAIQNVTVDLTSGHGVEGAARNARYRAIEAMAVAHNIDVILLAHHQQDQAETVLMRLLRGSGVTGLAAMSPVSRRKSLCWVRPWLNVSREVILEQLASFSAQTGWLPVDDPSNIDDAFARGTLRTKVIPAVSGHWPAWQQTLARHAEQAAAADRLLIRYGQQLLGQLDLKIKSPWPVLSLERWRELPPDEQALVIRVWLRLAGVQMPTERRLTELVRQLRQLHALGHDRKLHWNQSDCQISCIRGQLHLHVKITGFEGENPSSLAET